MVRANIPQETREYHPVGDPAAPPLPAATGTRRLTGIGLIVVLAAAVLAHGNGLSGEFLYDDFPYIVDNPQVQHGSMRDAWTRPLADRETLGLYRPLAVMTYQWQRHCSAAAFHAFNLALHAMVSALVFLLAQRLRCPFRTALLAGLLFAVHPIHVEAVTWIVGRAELLAALLGLAMLLVGLRSPRLPATLLGALLLFLACLGKEGAMALPGVLFVLDVLVERRRRIPDLALRYGIFALTLVAVIAIRHGVIGQFGPLQSLAPYADRGLLARLPVVLNLLAGYFGAMVFPWPLRIFYHHSEFLGFSVARLGILLAAAGVTLTCLRRARVHGALLVAFVISLFPTLNLVPIQETFAERFLYLPSAFFCIPLAAGLLLPFRLEVRRRGRMGWSLVLPVTALALLIVGTLRGNQYFADALTLWRRNVALAPDLPFPHYQLAYFSERDEIFTRRSDDLPGALAGYQKALVLSDAMVARGFKGMPVDQRARAHLSLGLMYSQRLPEHKRDPVRAAAELHKALQICEEIAQLDWEYASTLTALAYLRHFGVGVSREDAERMLGQARVLATSDDQRGVIERELERVRSEAKEAEDPPGG